MGKPWHEFKPGDTPTISEIVTAIEGHVRAGKVQNSDHIRALLGVIERASSPWLRFDPAGDGRSAHGWGRSPMNPRVWVTPEGERLEVAPELRLGRSRT